MQAFRRPLLSKKQSVGKAHATAGCFANTRCIGFPVDSRLRGNDGIVIFTIISARVLSANAFAEKMQKGRLKPYSQISDDLCSNQPYNTAAAFFNTCQAYAFRRGWRSRRAGCGMVKYGMPPHNSSMTAIISFCSKI